MLIIQGHSSSSSSKSLWVWQGIMKTFLRLRFLVWQFTITFSFYILKWYIAILNYDIPFIIIPLLLSLWWTSLLNIGFSLNKKNDIMLVIHIRCSFKKIMSCPWFDMQNMRKDWKYYLKLSQSVHSIFSNNICYLLSASEHLYLHHDL